jgi:hypothetical protein
MRRSNLRRLLIALSIVLGLGSVAAPAARADGPSLVVDWPSDGAAVGASVAVTGWAVAPAVERGTGVDGVRAYLDGPAGAGTLVGRASYGLTRSDVALALREARYGASGWRLDADLPPGARELFVYAHLADQPEDEGWIGPVQVAIRVAGGTSVAGLGTERPAPALAAPAAGGACVTREPNGAPCAASVAPSNNCAVPDRETGRCLVRASAASNRGPTAVVPGSWTAPDPAGGTSASNPSGAGGTRGRIGYPVVIGGAGERTAADGMATATTVASTGAASTVVGSATTSAAAGGRPAGAALSLTVASMGGRQVQLNWNAVTAGGPITYEVRRCAAPRCAALTSAAATCGVVAAVQGGGYRLPQADGYYFVRAVGPQGQASGESNRVQLFRG